MIIKEIIPQIILIPLAGNISIYSLFIFYMKRIQKINDLVKEIENIKTNSNTIGFIPTMGALHKGHLSLVEKCKGENNLTIVSIFINPTQFNDKADLQKYPRTIETDLVKLENIGCGIVFYPSEKEMCPKPDNRIFDLNGLDKVMEGKFREGHFNGVAIAVTHLFNLVRPDKSYFGEKDFQQLTIIKYLVKILKLPLEIISCPTIREEDGLAMSSRNLLLSGEQRKFVKVIPQTLFNAKKYKNQYSVQELINWVTGQINSTKGLEVEYFEIVDDINLKPIRSWNENKKQVACIAVKVGRIRLIDNLKFN